MSIISFLKEVKLETKKIKWPNKKHIIMYTFAVIIISALIALYLGTLDALFARLLSMILN